MFPVKSFYAKSNCEFHGEADFEITFLNYNPCTHQINYFFCCNQCIEEEGECAIGTVFSCSVKEWNRWTPVEDEPCKS